MAASAVAQVVVEDGVGGNTIDFTLTGGSINFGSGGSITGLENLTVSGAITADQLISNQLVLGASTFAAGDIATTAALNTTNANVTAAQTAASDAQAAADGAQTAANNAQSTADTAQAAAGDAQTAANNAQTAANNAQTTADGAQTAATAAQDGVTALEGQFTALGDSFETDSLDVANGALVASGTGVSVGTNLDMGNNKITNLADGDINGTSSDAVTGKQIHNLLLEEGASGIRYFHASSTDPDSEANGANSVAIGPNTVADGDNSFAAGDGAEAREANSFAAGNGAIADGESSIALGDGAQVVKPVNNSDPFAAIAIGKDSESSGAASTAIGHEANAAGGNALALGAGASAAGANGVALGNDAVAGAANNISIGNAAGLNTAQHLPGDRSHNTAIGNASGQNVQGQFNLAIGDQTGNNVVGTNNVAFGRQAGNGMTGHDNISIGRSANSNTTAERAITIGLESSADTEGVAIGYNSSAGNTGVAVGRQTTALGTGTAIGPNAYAESNHVALGLNSFAGQSDVGGSSVLSNRPFSGSVVSVGSSQAGSEFTRRIVNVEDGANDTDAVNVRQLQLAVSNIDLSDINFADGIISNLQSQIDQNMLHYVSVNDGGDDKGNKNNNGASAAAIDSIAIGPDATTKNQDSIAIGHLAGAEGDSAVVLGHNIKGLGLNSTTIGNSQSEAHGESGIAIGTNLKSRDENSIVIGRDSYTDRQANGASVENSIVVGTSSSSTAVEGIVIGKNSVVNAARGIAQGSNANATAADAMAYGTGSRANAVNSQASGTSATAHAARGIAMGTRATAGEANPDVSTAADNVDSIAIGTDSLAIMNSSVAMGTGANATANYSQAFGFGAEATAVDTIAQGRGAQATAVDAIAQGRDATASSEQAIAIGQGATASHTRSIALGDGAETATAQGTANATLNNLTYGNFAGQTPVGTVSVGKAGDERTVTNVAAGRISSTSTDAINGSQLYATNTVLGNVANTTIDILGGNATLAPDGSLSMSDIGDTGEDTIHDAIKYAAQGWNVGANGEATANVAPGGSVDFSSSDGNIDIARTGTDLDFSLADDIEIGNSITVGDTVINGDSVTSNNINSTNLTVTGETRLGDNFVVNNDNTVTYNGSEIATQTDGLSFAGNTGTTIAKTLGDTGPLTISGELAEGEESTGANLRVDSDGTQLNLVMAQNLTDINSITINNGGPVINGDGINMRGNKITDLAAGTEDTDAVNLSQLKELENVTNAGWTVTDANDNDANIGPNGQVQFLGDSNLTVTQTGEDQEGVIQIALNENIDLGADGSLTTGDTVINNDGVAVGDNVALTDTGLSVTDGAGNTTSTTAAGTTVTNTAGDTTTVGAGNISVADASGNETVVGSTQVSVGGSNPIVIDGDSGTIGGLTNQTIDYPGFADGSGRAATEEQLSLVGEVANAGWYVTDFDGNSANIGPKGQVQFLGDSNLTVTQTGEDQEGVIEITLNKDIDLGADGSLTTGDTVINNDGVAVGDNVALTDTGLSVTDGAGNTTSTTAAGTTVTNTAGDTTTVGAGNISVADASGNETVVGSTQVSVGGSNPIVIDGDSGTIGGLTNTTFDPDNFTSGQAATEDQLKQVSDVANAGWTVLDADGNNANIGPNGEVTFVAGNDNLSVELTDDTQNAGVMEITLADNIELSENGSIAIGDGTDGSTLDANGLAVIDGGSSTDIGAGTIAVTDAAGTTTIAGNQVAVGGNNPILISGDTGVISGLQNQTINYPGFADGSGRAATEEQLKPITDFVALNDDGTFSYNGSQHATLQDALNSMHWNVEAPAPGDSQGGTGGSGGGNGGSNGGNGENGGNSGNGGGNTTPIHNGNTVGFVEGDNIVISKTDRPDGAGADITIGLAQDITVNSITAVNVEADRIEVSNGGPVIDSNGIDMNGNRITNLEAGINETDAVNVGQLNQAVGNINNQINNLENQVRRNDHRASAGIAAAMAVAGLPQAYLPGKSMFSMAGGTWRGETGYAMGLSTITDSGKWVVKGAVSGSSRGDYGGTVGVGYQW